MTTAIRIIGITDEVGTCDCCGRTDLKRTVVLDRDGSRMFFGTECAARAMGSTAKVVKTTVRKVEDERVAAERAERSRKEREADMKFQSFLDSRSSKPGRALQLQELGGFAKAREMFAAA